MLITVGSIGIKGDLAAWRGLFKGSRGLGEDSSWTSGRSGYLWDFLKTWVILSSVCWHFCGQYTMWLVKSLQIEHATQYEWVTLRYRSWPCFPGHHSPPNLISKLLCQSPIHRPSGFSQTLSSWEFHSVILKLSSLKVPVPTPLTPGSPLRTLSPSRHPQWGPEDKGPGATPLPLSDCYSPSFWWQLSSFGFWGWHQCLTPSLLVTPPHSLKTLLPTPLSVPHFGPSHSVTWASLEITAFMVASQLPTCSSTPVIPSFPPCQTHLGLYHLQILHPFESSLSSYIFYSLSILSQPSKPLIKYLVIIISQPFTVTPIRRLYYVITVHQSLWSSLLSLSSL